MAKGLVTGVSLDFLLTLRKGIVNDALRGRRCWTAGLLALPCSLGYPRHFGLYGVKQQSARHYGDDSYRMLNAVVNTVFFSVALTGGFARNLAEGARTVQKETVKYVDLKVFEPFTSDACQVQIKTCASLADFQAYVDAFTGGW